MKYLIQDREMIFRVFLIVALAAGMLFLPSQAVQADTKIVTNDHDSGSGSLRQAIADAEGGDIITFDGDYTITLISTLVISKDLTIDGSGHDIIISGDNSVGVIQIEGGSIVSLTALTITDGQAISGGGVNNSGTLTVTDCIFSGNSATNDGGGIYSNSGVLTTTVIDSIFSDNTAEYGGGIYAMTGLLTVMDSTLLTNTADYGGGIYNWGSLHVTGSTFSGDTGNIGGGGLYTLGGSMVKVTNSTFSANLTGMFGYGGGIYNGSPLEILNSTISDNTADYGAGLYNEFAVEMGLTNTIIANSIRGGDCLNDKGTISTNINNLVEDGTCSDGGLNFKTGDPLLDVLGDNGGLTQTLALLPGSPAIDAGDTSLGPLTDQRGVYRPQGFQTDIGAYELVQYMIYLPLIMSNE